VRIMRTGTGRATKEPAAGAAAAITAVTGSTTAVTAATGAPAPAGGPLAVAANGNHWAAEVAISNTAVETLLEEEQGVDHTRMAAAAEAMPEEAATATKMPPHGNSCLSLIRKFCNFLLSIQKQNACCVVEKNAQHIVGTNASPKLSFCVYIKKIIKNVCRPAFRDNK
jgi:hypothetical protein